MDLARAPRRAARKKGSGYENTYCSSESNKCRSPGYEVASDSSREPGTKFPAKNKFTHKPPIPGRWDYFSCTCEEDLGLKKVGAYFSICKR